MLHFLLGNLKTISFLFFQRKPEDEENESEAKKTKQENGSGDATAANGEKGVDSSSTDKTVVNYRQTL